MERNREQLRQMQNMPLEIKIQLTRDRIREWVRAFGVDGVYVSFSGGKDSTVLLHIIREMYPDIEAVFVDTGLEYPETRKFVKTFDNVTILKPEMNFQQVITKYGYPVISKQISNVIYEVKNGIGGENSSRKKRLYGEYISPNGQFSTKFNCKKYLPLLDVDFDISDRCCYVMKKAPIHKYEKATKKKPFTGEMACESLQREANWMRTGCNAFDSKHKISKPMGFWMEQDVLRYIKENDITINEMYGEIVELEDQTTLLEIQNDLTTSGLLRTGCVFCAYGAHCEKKHRFISLKKTHPRLYDYCINGGEYGENGKWMPNNKGLGMGHVFDQLNETFGKNGKDFIPYK